MQVNFCLFKQFEINHTAHHQVDCLLMVLQYLIENEIVNNKNDLFKQLGIEWKNEWIKQLNAQIFSSSSMRTELKIKIFSALMNDLQFKQFSDSLIILQHKFIDLHPIYKFPFISANIANIQQNDIEFRIVPMMNTFHIFDGISQLDTYILRLMDQLNIPKAGRDGIMRLPHAQKQKMISQYQTKLSNQSQQPKESRKLWSSKQFNQMSFNFVQIAMFYKHSLALDSDNKLYGFGDNYSNQLSFEDTSTVKVPKLCIQASDIKNSSRD